MTALRMWAKPVGVNARYFHVPRSAAYYPHGLGGVFWCGQGFTGRVPGDFTDEAPEEMRCGRCVGAYLGHRREDGLVFAPRDHFDVPARCPGGADARGRCVGCGRRVRYYGWSSREAQHRPEPEFAERWRPCPKHGWRWVDVAYEAGTGVATGYRCGYFRCEVGPRRVEVAT